MTVNVDARRDELEAKRAELMEEKTDVDSRLREVRGQLRKARVEYKATGKKKTTLKWFNEARREVDEKAKQSQQIQSELAKVGREIKALNKMGNKIDALLWRIARAVDEGDVNVFDYLTELDYLKPGWRGGR